MFRKVINFVVEILKRKFFLDDTIAHNPFGNTSFSQEGEDIMLKRIIGEKSQGFYIDVGAHHPYRFSNTFIFYEKGWKGLNIDALPGTKELFDRERPRDINLEVGVSQSGSDLTYYMFNEPALNTFDVEESKKKDGSCEGQYFIENEKTIKTEPLSSIFDRHLSEGQEIDFMTVDVEGLDLEVLKSNDWKRYRPQILLVEELDSDLQNVFTNSEVYQFLKAHNYRLIAKLVKTSVYSSQT
jgi:FkbM family methyltransferase